MIYKLFIWRVTSLAPFDTIYHYMDVILVIYTIKSRLGCVSSIWWWDTNISVYHVYYMDRKTNSPMELVLNGEKFWRQNFTVFTVKKCFFKKVNEFVMILQPLCC